MVAGAPALGEAVERGLVSESALDAAVARVLTLKFRLGLFEEPLLPPVGPEAGGHSDPGMTCGGGVDLADLASLPGQRALPAAVSATGTPVVVLVQGHPHALPELDAPAAAVLSAWYPGRRGGRWPRCCSATPSPRPAAGVHAPLRRPTARQLQRQGPPLPRGALAVRGHVLAPGARAGGFVRLCVAPGDEAEAVFEVGPDTPASVGRDLRLAVAPGVVELETRPASDRTTGSRLEITDSESKAT